MTAHSQDSHLNGKDQKGLSHIVTARAAFGMMNVQENWLSSTVLRKTVVAQRDNIVTASDTGHEPIGTVGTCTKPTLFFGNITGFREIPYA